MLQYFSKYFLTPITIAVVTAVLTLSTPALAHELGQNNGISVILHVEPDDVPVAGAGTQLQLYYNTIQPGTSFNVARCRCAVEITKNGRTLASSKVQTQFGNGTQATAYVDFPRIGVYGVAVLGAATDGSFSSFRIPFTLRVTQARPVTHNHTQSIELVIAGLGVAGLGAALILQRRRHAVKVKGTPKA